MNYLVYALALKMSFTLNILLNLDKCGVDYILYIVIDCINYNWLCVAFKCLIVASKILLTIKNESIFNPISRKWMVF